MNLAAVTSRATVLVLTLSALFALAPASSATAAPSTEPSAKRIGTTCAKRAGREAEPAERREARRRCLKQMNGAAARRLTRDVTPPSVSWALPGAGATVKGVVEGSRCEAAASDNRAVIKVVMAVDGVTLNTESDAPWNCRFDTTRVNDGAHTLSATAYDAAGNKRTASVTVNVANAAAPKPAPQPAPVPEPTPQPEPTPAPQPEPTPSPTPTPSGDTAAPSVAWKVPTAGAMVKGRIEGPSCEADASDNLSVDRVVMKVDGATVNTESDAPWNCQFDTRSVADGTHTLSAVAYDEAGNSRTASVTVNVANTAPEPVPSPSPGPSPNNLVVAIDGGWGGWSWNEIQHRAQLGAAVTRHEWDITEPLNEKDNIVLAAASQIKTRIHPLIGANQLGDPTRYKEFVVAFIRRYGVGGTFWAEHPELDASRYAMTTFELGNEPYFGEMSASLYADTVRPALEEVKRLGLPAKIVLPVRAYGSDTSWMDTLYARISNLNDLVYAFAEHPYWYGHDPAQGTAAGPFLRIERTRLRMNEKGAASKPIFITEYGESTSSCGSQCVTEAVQEEHLKAMLNAAITRTEWKIEMVSVFQLIDRGTNSTDRELGFGLLRQNGTPKPSYSLVKGLMQQYRG